MQSKVSDVVLGKEKPLEESNPEYEKLKHYIYELEDHLAEAQKHAYRLVKRHRGNNDGCKQEHLSLATLLSLCYLSFFFLCVCIYTKINPAISHNKPILTLYCLLGVLGGINL